MPAVGKGLLVTAVVQLCIGVILLGLFEGYKVQRIKYFDDLSGGQPPPRGWDPDAIAAQSAIASDSPMGVAWWLSITSNVCSVFAVAGVLSGQRPLVMAFFGWSAVQAVAGLHFFVDIAVDTTVRYGGEPPGLTRYEKATAAFLFLQVLIALAATALSLRAARELKLRRHGERLVALPLSTGFGRGTVRRRARARACLPARPPIRLRTVLACLPGVCPGAKQR
ncbi:MAG: hypothetical protein J3K34DRAFT_421945 [Monoraphidium minutum]|nr:MAG: hypothetical protein J3K34DRAFT_421945 [Monoraphidium minutum]